MISKWLIDYKNIYSSEPYFEDRTRFIYIYILHRSDLNEYSLVALHVLWSEFDHLAMRGD